MEVLFCTDIVQCTGYESTLLQYDHISLPTDLQIRIIKKCQRSSSFEDSSVIQSVQNLRLEKFKKCKLHNKSYIDDSSELHMPLPMLSKKFATVS